MSGTTARTETRPSGLVAVRITRRMLVALDGGSLFQSPDDVDVHGYGDEGRRLARKVDAADHRQDGSVLVELADDERAVLYELADVTACSAQDDAGAVFSTGDGSALADLNSARALMRQLDRARRTCSVCGEPVRAGNKVRPYFHTDPHAYVRRGIADHYAEVDS